MAEVARRLEKLEAAARAQEDEFLQQEYRRYELQVAMGETPDFQPRFVELACVRVLEAVRRSQVTNEGILASIDDVSKETFNRRPAYALD